MAVQREKEGVKLPVYKITNELNKTILTHRENLSPFQEPNFAENLAKTQTEPEERPKSENALTTRDFMLING